MMKRIIDNVIKLEGGFVDDPKDSGGATKYGITQKLALAYGHTGAMKDLTEKLAFHIYEQEFWIPLRCYQMPESIAEEVFDTAVNCGSKTAAYFLQRCLNVFNDGGKLYPDILRDGIIGEKTIQALNSYLSTRREDVLLKALNGLQTSYYLSLAERRSKDERFAYGWIANRT